MATLQDYLSGISQQKQPGFTKMAQGPVLSPEIGTNLAAVWGGEPSQLNQHLSDLLNPTPPPSIQNVLNKYESEGTTTLQNLKAPTAPTFNIPGFERASANALGGKTVIPQVETNYMAQMKDQFSKSMNTYKDTVTKGLETIQSLGNPDTAKTLTLDFMQGNINQTLSMLQNQGYDVSSLYNGVVNAYNQSNEYMTSMNKFFQNVLGLKYNLPGDIQQAINAKNYSDWLIGEATPVFSRYPAPSESVAVG